jgi:amino acid transporter
MTNSAQPLKNSGNLRNNCLSYPEVIAQSISVIAPSTVPAAIIGLIFLSAGNGTWLSFLLGMIGLLFVSSNINQFARRSASPGSLYTYIVKGLGPTVGVLSGWALLLGYTLTGMSTLCGFAIFGQLLLGEIGLHVPILALFAFGVIVSYFVAHRDIQLSAKMMLVFEAVSISAILLLGILVWVHSGFKIDTDQLTLKGATPGGVLTGIVLVVFGFSGFESSTALGDEAKDPLRSIPRSLTQSTIISGVFFILMAYLIILGFKGTGIDLGKTDAPLDVLAPRTGVGLLGTLINIGALLSFFSCTLACINSTARIVFSMARHGLFHDALGAAHEKNETPHIAVGLSALITFLVPALAYLSGVGAFEGQGYFGTLSSLGFLLVYILVSIAAPAYLRHLGKLRKADLLYSALGAGFMILPLLGTIGIPGSSLFPPPAYPNNLLVWIFVAYMAVGLGWLLIQKARTPKLTHSLKTSIDEIHVKFGDVKNVPLPESRVLQGE